MTCLLKTTASPVQERLHYQLFFLPLLSAAKLPEDWIKTEDSRVPLRGVSLLADQLYSLLHIFTDVLFRCGHSLCTYVCACVVRNSVSSHDRHYVHCLVHVVVTL